METAPPASEGLSRRTVAILLAYGLTLFLIGLGRGRALTQHEVFAAQPAREMLNGAGWTLPRIAGVIRTAKPPTTSWLIAGSFALLGGAGEFAARLPSALSGVLVAFLIASLAARFHGQRVALFAGLIQLTCFYPLMQARLSEADMPLCAATTGALYAFARGAIAPDGTPRSSRPLSLAFYLCAGVSFLFKGLVGPLVIFAGVGVFLCFPAERRRIRFLASPVGILLCLLLMAAWPVAAYRAYPGILEIWRREQFGRVLGEMGATHPLPYYLYWVPLLLLPWVPLVLPGILFLKKTGEWRHPLWRLFACWFVPGLVLFSASVFKHRHYVIPLLPPFSILMGLGLVHYLRYREAHPMRRPRLLAILLTAGCAAGAFVVHKTTRDGTEIPRMALVAVLWGCGLTAIAVAARRRLDALVVTLFATVWLVAVGIFTTVMPAHNSWGPYAELARQTASVVPADQPIYLLGLGEHQMTFYLPPRLVRLDSEEELRDRLPAAGDLYALAEAPTLDRLRGERLVEILAEASYGGGRAVKSKVAPTVCLARLGPR